MSYVIAAYGVTGVILLAYGIQLARERKSLAASSQIAVDSEAGGAVKNP